MGSPQGSRLGSSLALGSALLAAGCRAPTELVVDLHTDLPCETVSARGVRVDVGASSRALTDRTAKTTTTTRCSAGSIGSLIVLPNEGRSSDVVFIDVAAGVDHDVNTCGPGGSGDGCIRARRRVSFVAHQPVSVPITLSRACVGVACADDQTCESGRCVSIDCVEASCAPAPVDAGPLPTAEPPEPPLSCAAGLADCDGLRATGCETNLGKDVQNCGACGHGCGGLDCVDGVCAPTTVLAGIDLPTGIAASGEDVYVTSNTSSGALLGCRAERCAAPIVLRSNLVFPESVAVDAGRLYWGQSDPALVGGSVSFCTLPDCTSAKEITQNRSNAFAVVESFVFFPDLNNSYIARWPKAGGQPQVLALSGATARPFMAADDQDVYFADGDVGFNAMAVRRCPFVGCSPGVAPSIAQAPADTVIDGLAIDDTHFYWSERLGRTGRVMRHVKADLSSNAEVFYDGADGPGAIAVDAAHVYVAERSGGRILRFEKTGGPPVVLAKDENTPYNLALTSTRVLWTNRIASVGSVRSVRK